MRMHVIVSGRVQGIGFRWFVREAALELDLSGCVRNRDDGTVEVEADGDDAGMARFRTRLRDGPPHAYVRSVDDVDDADGAKRELPRPFEIVR
jgi:acylphosphatase